MASPNSRNETFRHRGAKKAEHGWDYTVVRGEFAEIGEAFACQYGLTVLA
jgi:hypothetical protein